MHFKKYFLLYTIIPLLALSLASSYYRFLVAEDYLVEYEVECNPEKSSCYIGCEDDACLISYHYSIATKKAANLLSQCGPDITNCQSAQECLTTEDEYCSIRYCDPVVGGEDCETIEEELIYDNKVFENNTNIYHSPDKISDPII